MELAKRYLNVPWVYKVCGINGIVKRGKKISQHEIISMNKAIKHRGPDDEGIFINSLNKFGIGFGHVRLSILDLSEKGHQPMGYSIENDKIIYKDKELEKADIIIVHNGEVYNYLELAEKYNLNRETNTDTEVILKLYCLKGIDFVRELNGMWAFCIYDKRTSKIFCSRDRVGKKPFYYLINDKEFVFSSELKGILSIRNINKKENISKEAVELYFSLGFIPSPYTIYKNIFKLPASHILIFDINKWKISLRRYWKLPKYAPSYENKEALKRKFLSLLEDAVRIRLRSEVPIGCFLSSGLDSSVVTYFMKKFVGKSKLHSFSVGFEGKYDESPHIKKIVKVFDTIHHHIYFNKRDFDSVLDIIPYVFDEPYGDHSIFPTYKISEFAKKEVGVVLSGDGGDEILGGYEIYVYAKIIDILRKLPFFLRKILARIPMKNKSEIIYRIGEAFRLSLLPSEKIWSEAYADIMYKPEIYKKWTEKRMREALKLGGSLDESMRIFDLLYRTLGDNYLTKMDRASMYHSLEVRCPFLDYRLIEFCQNIPSELRVGIFKTKKFMRDALSGILPKEIIKKKKRGFTPPIDKWIVDEKYIKEIKKKDKILKEISEDLYRFYREKVYPNAKDILYHRIYLIRLYIFIKWWEKWIRD